MADYRDRLEEWREAARRKARELDDKYGIKDRVEEGARAAQEAARRGAEKVAEGAERAKREAERLNVEQRISGQARQAADEATRVAREAGDALRGASRSAGEAAGEAFSEARDVYERASSEARDVYERASRVAGRGIRLTRASTAATVGLFKARKWVREHPRRAAAITFSLAAGIPLGFAFPRLDSFLFGAHPHWLTHSALPVYGLRKAGEKFDEYLRKRESLIAAGQLGEAERERAEFERKIARYVGAPLLGAFSCAAGVGMWVQIFQPGRITGAPISWLLGGNPVLDGIWLFANGVLCIQQGYKFFMIALEHQEDVEQVIRELKGLLPAAPV
ncbi:MAG: hypothetical protein WKF30_00880 [Pyrinomonadaceae bacterium]